jgi:MraZ protein
MSVFFGTSKYNLDTKNRLTLPPPVRKLLKKEKAKHFMITVGLNDCLYLFLPSQWEKLISDNMSIFNSPDKERVRAFKRFFFGNAKKAEPDKLGKILLDPGHRQYAKLKKQVIIIGVGNKAEIWDSKSWQNYNKKTIEPNKLKFSRIYDI